MTSKMTDDEKRNATATWSGFAHQGLVGLLVALRKMVSISDKSEYGKYFVQYETREDAIIYREDKGVKEELSVHQVKAFYSKGNFYKSTYASALKGFKCCSNGENYLHTVCKIADWATSTTENALNIKRFPYTNDLLHCDTSDINCLIKSELTKLIDEPNNDGKVENAFWRLRCELDNKIREEHRKGEKPLFDIKFSFQELYNFILDDRVFQGRELFESRRLFYESFIEIKKESEDGFLEAEIDEIESDIIKHIYSKFTDSEFLEFLKLMNSDQDPDKLNYSQHNFNGNGFSDVFFEVMRKVSYKKAEIDRVVKYRKEGLAKKYALTTINGNNEKKVIRNIIRNIQDLSVLWEEHYLINSVHNTSLNNQESLLGNKIMGREKPDNTKFYRMVEGTELISVDKAIKQLNDD
jgi:hypothetical protein